MTSQILVVDDEVSIGEFLEIFISKMGHQVQVFQDPTLALKLLAQAEFDLVLTDLKMPRTSKLDILRAVKERTPMTQVIVMTAYSTTETAVDAMKRGAYDYLAKPFKIAEMKVVIEKALEKRTILEENQNLRGQLKRRFDFENIVGRSVKMQRVFELVKQIAPTKTNVLICGESGTGKELIARAIHYNSPRTDKPLVTINCGVIPENLMETEFFGHVKGAFTGAATDKTGLFEAANGGTLFLDEIGELPLQLQVKLLRVLEERKIKPVGSVKEMSVDVRIVAATNRDLDVEVKAGRFREDLYYRLNVIDITLPPLRERPDDIQPIAHYFVEKYAREMEKPVASIDDDVIVALEHHTFPGNVRELENLIERAIAIESGTSISISSMPSQIIGRKTAGTNVDRVISVPELASGIDLDAVIAKIERQLIIDALKKAKGIKKDAAKLLKISFRAIRYKVDKYEITDRDFAVR